MLKTIDVVRVKAHLLFLDFFLGNIVDNVIHWLFMKCPTLMFFALRFMPFPHSFFTTHLRSRVRESFPMKSSFPNPMWFGGLMGSSDAFSFSRETLDKTPFLTKEREGNRYCSFQDRVGRESKEKHWCWGGNFPVNPCHHPSSSFSQGSST